LVLSVEILPNLKAGVILHGDINNIHAFAGYSGFNFVAAILCLLQHPALRRGGDILFPLMQLSAVVFACQHDIQRFAGRFRNQAVCAGICRNQFPLLAILHCWPNHTHL